VSEAVEQPVVAWVDCRHRHRARESSCSEARTQVFKPLLMLQCSTTHHQ
jgi:hypothetical protein